MKMKKAYGPEYYEFGVIFGNGIGQPGAKSRDFHTATLDSRYRRSSSYDSFYKAASKRANLKVLYNAQVQALLPSPQGDSVAIAGACTSTRTRG